jgi:hypothetical protein
MAKYRRVSPWGCGAASPHLYPKNAERKGPHCRRPAATDRFLEQAAQVAREVGDRHE